MRPKPRVAQGLKRSDVPESTTQVGLLWRAIFPKKEPLM
jgi:hypothetical protein